MLGRMRRLRRMWMAWALCLTLAVGSVTSASWWEMEIGDIVELPEEETTAEAEEEAQGEVYEEEAWEVTESPSEAATQEQAETVTEMVTEAVTEATTEAVTEATTEAVETTTLPPVPEADREEYQPRMMALYEREAEVLRPVNRIMDLVMPVMIKLLNRGLEEKAEAGEEAFRDGELLLLDEYLEELSQSGEWTSEALGVPGFAGYPGEVRLMILEANADLMGSVREAVPAFLREELGLGILMDLSLGAENTEAPGAAESPEEAEAEPSVTGRLDAVEREVEAEAAFLASLGEFVEQLPLRAVSEKLGELDTSRVQEMVTEEMARRLEAELAALEKEREEETEPEEASKSSSKKTRRVKVKVSGEAEKPSAEDASSAEEKESPEGD